tara:strand:- start:139 stop:807 length:669 start_codon:yes stop_codon:yes gene_type:complete
MSGDSIVRVVDAEAFERRQTSKGERPSSSVSLSEDNLFWNPESLITTGDYIFGVDTNTLKIDDRTIHVTALTCATKQIKKDGYEGTIQPIQCFDFGDDDEVAEKIGWLIAITAISQSSPGPEAKIFLCTDHDAARLDEINRRVVPMAYGKFLPEGFTMVYARDKGSSIQNKVVKSAHKSAEKVIKVLKNEPPPQQFLRPFLTGETKTKIRRWKNTENLDFFF